MTLWSGKECDCVKRHSSCLCRLPRFKIVRFTLHYITRKRGPTEILSFYRLMCIMQKITQCCKAAKITSFHSGTTNTAIQTYPTV